MGEGLWSSTLSIRQQLAEASAVSAISQSLQDFPVSSPAVERFTSSMSLPSDTVGPRAVIKTVGAIITAQGLIFY
jgi:hypothetical protein